VGRGIVFNALAVVVGFSVLAFSNFLPVRFFGFLVVVSILACLLAALALMPALVVWLDPRFARAAQKPALASSPSRTLPEHL
jgi:predicted RND superfamily exporter protein